jgi:pyruvate,water dikinase
MHLPGVLYPFDSIILEFAAMSLGQYNTRVFVVPPALGWDYRVLNGYVYFSPIALTDGDTIAARSPHFLERAGHYFQNWDDLYQKWLIKIRRVIADIDRLEFVPLPAMDDRAHVTEGRGLSSAFDLISRYHTLIERALEGWQYHFELLNLGYAAYLDYFQFCKEAFPDIADQTVAKTVSGIEVDLFRPDDEVKRLARLALELSVAEPLMTGPATDALRRVAAMPNGARWLEEFEKAKDPWFNFSGGTGFYHHDPVWIDHLDVPFAFLRNYIKKLEAGETVARPLEAIRAERDRLVREYSALLPTDEDRQIFDAKLRLARTVFPYIENHNFYVEHWFQSRLWRKVRELGRVFVSAGFIEAADDVFCLRRDEVGMALSDLCSGWAVGAPARGPGYWPREVARRKRIIEALRQWSPPLALGAPPEVVTEPFTIMLMGITTDSIASWLRGNETTVLRGFPGSPGVVEGDARVVMSVADLDQVRDGEILVCPITAPSWGPIFSRIRATVTDIGGMMSHAAIVCREYGLPAVLGTGVATRVLKTGQKIRVDGNSGTVSVLGVG